MPVAPADELAELRPIFERFKLEAPIADLEFLKLFEDRTGRLRDKVKYAFNRRGEMDFVESDILTSIAKARFAIAKVLRYREEGLAPFEWRADMGCSRYFPKNTDWLFYYYLDDSYSNLYSEWERIACYLAIFWPSPKGSKVYFKTQIPLVAKAVASPHPAHLTWLVTLQDGANSRYSQLLNQHRRKITHEECSHRNYFELWLKSHASEAAVSELEDERSGRPDKLVECYQDLIEGVRQTLALIENQFDGNGQQRAN